MKARKYPYTDARRYVCEDPDKFGAGMVVVEDGYHLRMMITKVVLGFAETIWTERRVGRTVVCRNIFHTSVLTLDKDQVWTGLSAPRPIVPPGQKFEDD